MRALRLRGRPWKAARLLLALAAGLLWWWAAYRLAVRPGAAGPLEGAMFTAGWTLGLIPLHAVPAPAARALSRRRDPGRTDSADTSTPPGSDPPSRAART